MAGKSKSGSSAGAGSGRRVQFNVTISEDVQARIPEILDRAREILGFPGLSMGDVVNASLDLFSRWLDQREAAREDEAETLGDLEVTPSPPPQVGRPRKGGGGSTGSGRQGGGAQKREEA